MCAVVLGSLTCCPGDDALLNSTEHTVVLMCLPTYTLGYDCMVGSRRTLSPWRLDPRTPNRTRLDTGGVVEAVGCSSSGHLPHRKRSARRTLVDHPAHLRSTRRYIRTAAAQSRQRPQDRQHACIVDEEVVTPGRCPQDRSRRAVILRDAGRGDEPALQQFDLGEQRTVWLNEVSEILSGAGAAPGCGHHCTATGGICGRGRHLASWDAVPHVTGGRVRGMADVVLDTRVAAHDGAFTRFDLIQAVAATLPASTSPTCGGAPSLPSSPSSPSSWPSPVSSGTVALSDRVPRRGC